jgi:inward rectifier potassium channel
MSHDPYGTRRRGGVFRFGATQVKRRGSRKWYWSDLYHLMLAMSWPAFFGTVFGLYICTNLVFAGLFALQPDAVAELRGPYDIFFFSIETLATVGYGVMHPGTTYGHLIASAEILAGMLELSIVTGLMFARFSKPTARILFSNVAVIARFNGVPTLMFRAGNERNNLILEATVRASIARREKTAEGQEFTRFYDLPLERQSTSVFALSWTIMHRIDENSPLYGKSAEDLLDEGATLTLSMTGMDETLNDFVHARHSYGADEILYARRFVDVLSAPEGNVRWIDFDRFHDTIPDHAA